MNPCEANEKEVIKGGTGGGTLQYCHYHGQGGQNYNIVFYHSHQGKLFKRCFPQDKSLSGGIHYQFPKTYPLCMFQQLRPGLQSI